MSRLPFITSLKYEDPLKDFALVAGEPGSVLLHSSNLETNSARYSFWGFDPKSIFESREGLVTIDHHTQIDTPQAALKRFYERVRSLPA